MTMIDYQPEMGITDFCPPNSLESEQSVLGALLKDSYKLPDVCEIISSKDFYGIAHQHIFRAMEVLQEKGTPVDVMTVIALIDEQGLSEEIGGLGYLGEMAQMTPGSANIISYSKTIKGKSQERELIHAANQMLDTIYSFDGSSEEKINNALSLINGFDTDSGTQQSYLEMNKQFAYELDRRSNAGGGLTGYSTGFDGIDERLSGLQKSDLIVVAGRPGSGKTTYALNIASHIAKKKHALIFSMEMSGMQLIEKIYSSQGILMENLKRGELAESELAQIIAIGDKTKNLNITIDERGALTPEQVRAKATRVKRQYGEIGLIVVDYLQLMRVNKAESRTNEITMISGALKAIAKEINCPVIAISQLNRGVENRSNKRPVMSDLRDSGAIEQDADIIQFIYRDDYYAAQENRESAHPGIAEVNTAKFRGGQVGVNYLSSQLQYSRFKDHKNYSFEEKQREFDSKKKPKKNFDY